MKEVNLMDIERNLDDVVLMKRDIEALSESDEKMTLNEFFNTIKVYSTIFVSNGIIIPFSVVNGKDDTYFVYCLSTTDGISFAGNIKEKSDKAFEELKERLEKLKYDLSNLTQKSSVEMALLDTDLMSSATYFIIDNKYYV